MQQEYNSRYEFEQNANIDGKLLKNIWEEVSFAGFMFCGNTLEQNYYVNLYKFN